MTEEICAELVGTVLSVETAAGRLVTGDDVIIVLESMKMEIPVLAECSGTVVRVAVSAGDVVQGGDLVAVVDTRPGG